MSVAWKKITFWRVLIQWGFLLWILYIGIRFGLFVQHFTSQGATPYVERPAGVDGFLPIGGLASLKLWLTTGQFDLLHPAALVLLLTFLGMSLLAKKSFCSWLCPVGTLSEGAWKSGHRLFGRNLTLWRWLDVPLRGLKYLLLGFFVKILLIDMPATAVAAFLKTPYWALSDVKMLHFFTGMSLTTLIIVTVITLLSFLIKNVWCRYLCPYGALLGLVSLLSPFKIRRDSSQCTHCLACSRTCPAQIPVHSKNRVLNAECTGCLSCHDACPEGCLAMTTARPAEPLPSWAFPVLLLAIYATGVGLGMATGHWDSSLTYADYKQLLPMVEGIGH
jgi:polyferredoxin